MRITGLSIDGFGVFCDYRLADLPPGITVVLGPNEAGKSTLLAFIRGVFFGFGGRGHEAFVTPLRGGRPGGRIFVEADGTWTLEREPGRKKPLRVVRPDGREGTEADAAALLGGVDEKLFRNVFAFGLSELSDFGKLADQEVADRVFAGGIGGAGPSARGVASALDAEAGAIQKPRSPALLGGLLESLTKAQAELEKAREAGRGYAGRLLERDSRHAAVRELEQKREELRREKARCELLVELWPAWDAVEQARPELGQLEVVTSFPESGEARRAELERALETARRSRAEHEAVLAKNRRDRGELVLDAQLSEQSGPLEALRDGAELHRDNLRRLVDARRTLAARRERVVSLVAALGQEWTAERVAATDASLARVEEARAHRDRIARETGAAQRVAERVATTRELRDERRRAAELVARELTGPEPAPLPEIDSKLESLGRVEDLLAEQTRDDDRRLQLGRALELLSQEEQKLLGRVRALGEGWTLERVRSVDASFPTCDAGAALGQQLRSAVSELASAEADLKEAASTADERRRARERIAARLAGPEPSALEEIDALLETLARAETLLGELQTQRAQGDERARRLDDLRRERRVREDELARLGGEPPAWLASGFAVAAVIAIVLALAVGALVHSAAALGALVLAGAVLAHLSHKIARDAADRRSAAQSRRVAVELSLSSLARAEKERAELETNAGETSAALAEVGSQLGLSPSRPELERRRAELVEERSARVARDQAQADMAVADRELADAELALEKAREKARNTSAALATAHGALEAWKRKLALPDSATAEGAIALLRSLAGIQELAAEYGPRRRALESHASELAANTADRERALARIGETVGLAPTLTGADVASLRARLAAAREARLSWDRTRRDLETRKRELEAAEIELDQRTAELERAERSLGASQASFAEWKARLGLPAGAGAEGIVELLASLVQAQAARAEAQLSGREVEGLERAVAAWETSARTTLAAAGLPVAERTSGEALLEQLRAAGARVEADGKARALAGQLDGRRDEIALALDTIRRSIEAHAEALARLYAEAGATDGSDFDRRRLVFERRRELERIVRDREDEITRRLGRDDSSRTLLATGAIQEWRDRAEAIASQLLELESARDQALEAVHDADNDLRALEESADVAARELEVEAVRTEVREAVRRYRVLTLAKRLVDETLDEFVKTRQPAVLAGAAGTFASLTAGRYTSVVQDDDEHLAVIDRRGSRKTISQLSRGLAEQLYFSIRIGLVSEHARRGARIPLVLDDPFVNFDEKRTLATARAIAEFARTGHQVLVFTCHGWVRDLFLEADSTVRVVDLPASDADAERPRDDGRAKTILELLEAGAALKSSEIAARLGLDPDEVSALLRDLRDSGRVLAEGRTRGQRWSIAGPVRAETHGGSGVSAG